MTSGLEAYAELSEDFAALRLEDAHRRLTPEDFPQDLSDLTPFDGLVISLPSRQITGSADRPKAPFEIQDVSFGHDWYAEAEGYRRIALWLFHLAFSGRDFAGLKLCHDQCRVVELWVAVERPYGRYGLIKFDKSPRVLSCEYYGSGPTRHPFFGEDRIQRDTDRPLFRFGWSDDAARFRAEPIEADQIIVSMSPEGLAAFASLLLDFAMPWSTLVEMNLEPPFVGFAGTRPLSLGARFWLPGSVAFHSDGLDTLKLD